MLKARDKSKLPAGNLHPPAQGGIDFGVLVDDARDGANGHASPLGYVGNRRFTVFSLSDGHYKSSLLRILSTDPSRSRKPCQTNEIFHHTAVAQACCTDPTHYAA